MTGQKKKKRENLKQRDTSSFGSSYCLAASGCDHVGAIEKQRVLNITVRRLE